jgi:hypothetical protein
MQTNLPRKTIRTLLAGAAVALAVSGAADAADKKINADRDGPGKADEYKAVPSGYGANMVNKWVAAHKKAKGSGYKYVYVPTENASDKETANVLRVAAAKAWNHLSWKSELDLLEDVSEGSGLVFALDAKKIWGADAERNWGYVANCTPKGNISISPAPRGDCQRFGTDEAVAIPRFVFNATNGGPYANVHKTPPFFQNFAQKYRMSPIKAVSTHKEAIVCGPRITAYRTVEFQGKQLLYSYSSDEFDGRDNGQIRYRNAPTERDQRQTGALNAGPGDGQTAIASEWWIQLPNGFMYYSIHGEGAQERGKAEFPFAIDPANWKQQATLATGRSCITCHATGIQAAKSDKEYAGKNGWTSNAELDKLYKGSRGQFQGAMRKLVDALSDGDAKLNDRMVNGTIEPIAKAIRLIEGPYRGGNYACDSFCNGKFSARRRNMCDTIPEK